MFNIFTDVFRIKLIGLKIYILQHFINILYRHFSLKLLIYAKSKLEQDRQALLKAKYCPRVAPVASAGSNKVARSSG